MAKKFMFVCIGMLAMVASFAVGSISGQASSSYDDVAVRTGVIHHGEQIPLPAYSDGTQAAPEECRWLVAPRHMNSGHNSMLGLDCTTYADRTVVLRQITIEGEYYDGHATYIIVAVRPGDPTAAQSSTWGGIKAQFKD